MTFGFIHDTPKEGRLNGESMHKHNILLSNENGPLDYSLAPIHTGHPFNLNVKTSSN